MNTIPKKNNFPSVVRNPTPANRSMNKNVTVSKSPSNPNKHLNKPARVNPSK